jgi:hypothetical protein
MAAGPFGIMGILLAVISFICMCAALRPVLRSTNRRSYPIVEYGPEETRPREAESRETTSYKDQPTERSNADHQGEKLSEVKRGLLVLGGLAFFLAANWVTVPTGEFIEKLVISIFLVLLAILMELLAIKGRPVLASRSSKRGLVSGVLIFVVLFMVVFLFLLPPLLDDGAFYDRALKTDALVTGVSSYYDSEDGTWYKLTVKFTEQGTGNQITGTLTTGNRLNVDNHVSILYDPQDPTKIRFSTQNRLSWQSLVTVPTTMSAFIMNIYLGIYVLSVAKSMFYPSDPMME